VPSLQQRVVGVCVCDTNYMTFSIGQRKGVSFEHHLHYNNISVGKWMQSLMGTLPLLNLISI